MPSPVSSRRTRFLRSHRRRLLTTTVDQVEDALLAMNSAISQGLVAGEEFDAVSTHLGMRTTVIDSTLVGASGDVGLSIEVGAASSSGLPGGVTPSMVLPRTFSMNATVAVAAINYGKSNPYEMQGGVIAEGASINSFTLNGMEVSGLVEPIVLSLPLPSMRRRLSAWNGTWGSKDFAQSYSVNCGGRNRTRLEALYTAHDLSRAQFCGTEHLLENMTKLTSWYEPWINASKNVWCNSTQERYFMDCEGRTGIINYTCPVYYPVSTCMFWDTIASRWSTDGCTYWRTDTVAGVAYCNCTHLTSFTSEEGEALQSSTQTFVDVTGSAEDLTGKDVLKNLGVLVLLLFIWAAAAMLYSYDALKRRFELMHLHLSEESFDQYQALTSKLFITEKMDQTIDNTDLEEELRETSEPSRGMLYSEVKDVDVATDAIDIEARSLSGHFEKRSNFWKEWLTALRKDNQINALFDPNGYQREAFTKRAVFLLVEVLSLLFVAVLYSPRNENSFICPGEISGGGGLLNFAPDLDPFAFLFEYVTDKIQDAIINCVWLWPVTWLMWALYSLSRKIFITRRMHEARLFELQHLSELLEAYSKLIDDKDIKIAKNMLNAAKGVLKRLSLVIYWRKTYLNWPQWLQRVMASWFGLVIPQHHRLEDYREDIATQIQRIEHAIKRMKHRLESRRREKYHWFVRFCYWAIDFESRNEESAQVAHASIPKQIQLRIIRRKALISAIDGTSVHFYVLIRIPYCFRSFVRWTKVKCFEMYSGYDDEETDILRPIEYVQRIQQRVAVFGFAYLVFVTFFIFLAAVRIGDNNTIRVLLITTFVLSPFISD